MTKVIPENKELRLRWFQKLIDPANRCMNLRHYVKKIFNRKLEKNQYFTLRDMLDPKIRNIYFSTARQAGKTETIAIYQALCAQFPDCVIPHYDGRGNCYVFAPKKEQAQISFERFSNLIHLNEHGVFDNAEFLADRADKLRFQNGFEVRAITASRNAEIEGLTTHIIIIDESQAVSPYKVRECLTGDTIVPLANGSYATLKEIIDRKLTVLTPTGETAPIKYFEYDEDVVYEITLVNGKTLKCNASHEHLAYHKNWRDTEYGATKKLNTLELKEGHRLATSSELPYFGHIGNYNKGLIVGSFLGDGCVSGTKPEFCGNAGYVNDIHYRLNEEFGNIQMSIKKETDKLVEVTYVTGTNKKNSNPLTKYLRSIGIWGMKGDNKQIPNNTWSKEFLQGAIAGLINTDGCVFVSSNKRGFICFDNISEQLVKQLQDYLIKFGIHSRVSVRENNGELGYATKPLWTLTIKSVNDILKFYDNFELVIEKQYKLEKLVEQCKTREGRDKSEYYSENLRFSRIKSIKKLDKKEKVYCVQVSGNHQWIANGIVTFNSILPMGGGVKGGAKVIQCGVPGILGSHFHKAYKNKYDEVDNPFGYKQHIYPWTECPRVEEAYIMTLKAEDDESFERNYELNWARNNFGYFLTEDIYNDCEADYEPLALRRKGVEEGWEFHWGIDFAKLRDSTVLTEWGLEPETGEFYITKLIELRGIDYTDQVGYFANIFNPQEVVHASADRTAVGEPVVELLNSKGIRTTGEIFSTQNKDKIYKNFKHVIENRKAHWPKSSSIKGSKEFKRNLARFKQQLLELEMEYRVSGHVLYHHNLDDNLARDDYADSAALGIWSAMQYVPPSIGYVEDM